MCICYNERNDRWRACFMIEERKINTFEDFVSNNGSRKDVESNEKKTSGVCFVTE